MALAGLLVAIAAQAHFMWLETAETGKLNKVHEVKVRFGEYTYGVIEDPAGEHFQAVLEYKLWAVFPSGNVQLIETEKASNGFSGSFIPTEKGTYTLVLNNDEIDVIDYTQYNFGIFKTHYHATARVVVGESPVASVSQNTNGLAIVDMGSAHSAKDATAKLKVTYKGAPLASQEVTIFVADLWSKKVKTNADGEITFNLPWNTQYVLETTYKEEVPGTYKGADYEFIWHCATYNIFH